MADTTRLTRQPHRLGIYVHYPYCIRKCYYCDFFSVPLNASTASKTNTLLAEGIAKELESRRQFFENTSNVDSIFFGGGTPSLLSPDLLDSLIGLFRSHFNILPECEITVEGNPENISEDYLRSLSQTGVNRINVGIQTFAETRLKEMNRHYDPERYAGIIDILGRSAIQNTGVDLIYGFPGQSEPGFFEDLERALIANPKHLALYTLTREPGTPYHALIQKSQRLPPDEDVQASIFAHLPGILQREGFTRYEVSNYSRDGFACRHNLRYWLYEPYIGLGPGAHGFNGKKRYGNPRSIERWLESPAGASMEDHQPWIEGPLNLFRLAVFRPDWLLEILPEAKQTRTIVTSFFERQVRMERAEMDARGWFRWKAQALQFLDSILDEWMQAL